VNAWRSEEATGDPAIEAELQKLKERLAPATSKLEADTSTETNT